VEVSPRSRAFPWRQYDFIGINTVPVLSTARESGRDAHIWTTHPTLRRAYAGNRQHAGVEQPELAQMKHYLWNATRQEDAHGG
jgi:hypothetical protein